jgi:monofunctional biosynthetic peptidoglycan transglycosylase
MRKFFKRLLFIILLCVFAGLLFLGTSLVTPRLGWLRAKNPTLTSFQKYRMKEWREQGKNKTLKSYWSELSRISPSLQQAVVIAEDDKFWQHHGFDMEAMREAMRKNWEKKTLRFGGSSISQQLVKNLFLSPARSPIRKLREAILTWRLEKALSKKRILELYLNVVEWGDAIFGAEAAAGYYYGKTAAALSPREAARLAAILPMPRRYSRASFLRSRYLDRRVAEINHVMIKRGLVPDESDEQAESQAAVQEKQ